MRVMRPPLRFPSSGNAEIVARSAITLQRVLEAQLFTSYGYGPGLGNIMSGQGKPIAEPAQKENSEQVTSAVRPDAQPGNYFTQLPPAQEQGFRQWVKQHNVPFNPDDKSGTNDYDMRGYYKDFMAGKPSARGSEVNQFDGKPHFTDYYKTTYHTTFSEESQWAIKGKAPRWVKDRYLVAPDGKVLFDQGQREKPLTSFKLRLCFDKLQQ